MKNTYPKINPKQNFPLLEREVLTFWKSNKVFGSSLAKNKGLNQQNYVFLDGPPFANGLPHYGHLLTGYVKDLIPRFQTMRGKVVNRRFGWDCHGLPAEMDGQKQLNINGRKEIIEYGVDKFNAFCRNAVLKYTNEWQQYIDRQARWVDFEHAYKTMDTPFMESVIWAFKELYEKGLIYEGDKVMPYSWALETPLSNFETRLDNAYRSRQDPAITVAFILEPLPGETKPLKLMVWTTTPWTLPANLAIAVDTDAHYLIYERQGEDYIVCSAAAERYSSFLNEGVLIAEISGAQLLNRSYTPLFPYFKDIENAFTVLPAGFVSAAEGTGIVHMAPGFGEDDQTLCAEFGLPSLCPVDSAGRFTEQVVDYTNVQVFDANKLIIADLKKAGALLKQETINHQYPHCWRTDTPLIYKVQKSWYVNVTAFKDRMVVLKNEINWVPDHIKNGLFGNWLAAAKDWSISRSRFFGTPLPIWKSDNPAFPRTDVYGSLNEIKRDFNVDLHDLHKPFIDSLTRPNPDDPSGNSTMRRIDEVFDCWFESGAMPFAQLHYPFENQQLFEQHGQADFVAEYVAQTRGWFYTMMVLSTALFDRIPFKTAICHGVILDEAGEKISKSKRNYPDPLIVFEEQGADALRWYLMRSQLLKGGDLKIDKDGVGIKEASRCMIIPLWNAYSFFCLYANTDGFSATINTASENALDKYIFSKAAVLVEDVTQALDNYNIPNACVLLEDFIDVLNNWYIRRSRERFWKSGINQEKVGALNTLYTVLTVLTRLSAPFLPFITEEIYKGLTKEVSVHLTAWPQAAELPVDTQLMANMDSTIAVCSSGLSLRKKMNIRVRQPLSSITIYIGNNHQIKIFEKFLADEMNVKKVILSDKLDGLGFEEIVLNYKTLGPVMGKDFKSVIKDVKTNKYKFGLTGELLVGGYAIPADDFTVNYIPNKEMVGKSLNTLSGLVILNTVITDDLLNEGLIRDFIRDVQNRRKDLDLHIDRQINISVIATAPTITIVQQYEQLIKEQTLASKLVIVNQAESTIDIQVGIKFEINPV